MDSLQLRSEYYALLRLVGLVLTAPDAPETRAAFAGLDDDFAMRARAAATHGDVRKRIDARDTCMAELIASARAMRERMHQKEAMAAFHYAYYTALVSRSLDRLEMADADLRLLMTGDGARARPQKGAP